MASRRDDIIIHGNRLDDKEESMGSQHGDHFVNLERRRDHKVARSPSIRVESVHLDHISWSHLRPESHISHEQKMCNLKLEVGHLCR